MINALPRGEVLYENVPPRSCKWGGGGLRERPLTENWGFQSGPSLTNEGNSEPKNNKETYILKVGSFVAAQI